MQNRDRGLVEGLKQGKSSALDELFRKYSKKLYLFSYSLLKNHEDAEEIVQETFFRIWVRKKDISANKSFSSYLFTIAYNIIVDQFRKKTRQRDFEIYILNKAAGNCLDTQIIVEKEELDRQVQSVVSKLPTKRQKIYKLSRDEGMDNKEIANLLNISTKTVENQITLALKQIRKTVYE
jgi:RNA polymerase sigma-70 factor (ECF subfamily)